MKTAEERLEVMQRASIKEYIKQFSMMEKFSKANLCWEALPFMAFCDAIADSFNVPEDNSIETFAIERTMESGTWPEESYCRDWVLHLFGDASDGKKTEDDVFKELSHHLTP